MGAVTDAAGPILQLPMTFVLVSDPISFALEGFRFSAVGKGACEGLNIFMHVLGPVGGLLELFHFEAERAFEFGWQPLDRRKRNPRRELCSDNGALAQGFILLV